MNSILKALKSTQDLIDGLSKIIDHEMIIFCIGTPKCKMDSVGPAIGSKLKDLGFKGTVYGTIEDPINALNIEQKILEVKNKYPKNKILAIDSAVSSDNSRVGAIYLTASPILPGAGVGKKIVPIGDYSIRAVIATNDTFVHNSGPIDRDSEILLDIVIQTVSNSIIAFCK